LRKTDTLFFRFFFAPLPKARVLSGAVSQQGKEAMRHLGYAHSLLCF